MQLDESDEDEHVVAKVAYMSTDRSESNPWRLDSGCSRHMTRVVRGVPKLGDKLDYGCSSSNKGKQIKVNHKRVSEVGSKNLIKRFDMQTCKMTYTPISKASKLSKDEGGQAVDQKLYRSMIGSLLYLTASRPDLCHGVCLCARYQANPKVSHLNAAKRIIKYVKGTIEYGLSYTNHTNENLAGYCDADWSGCIDDRRNTLGGCFFLGNNLIAWHNKKQNCVSLSSTQAEYIAISSCCTQLLWMKQMLGDYGINSEILLIHCDNTGAIDITKNPVHHTRTKHIEIRYHFIRELVEGKLVEMRLTDV